MSELQDREIEKPLIVLLGMGIPDAWAEMEKPIGSSIDRFFIMHAPVSQSKEKQAAGTGPGGGSLSADAPYSSRG